MAANSGGSFGSATYNGSNRPAGGVLRLLRCCCLCGVESSTSSSRVGERGRSREGGSFTLLNRPTGDDASLSGDGDRDLDLRDPRLTTESSRAMSAAHESQSILAHAAAARLPFTASWVGISPVTWCGASLAAPPPFPGLLPASKGFCASSPCSTRTLPKSVYESVRRLVRRAETWSLGDGWVGCVGISHSLGMALGSQLRTACGTRT